MTTRQRPMNTPAAGDRIVGPNNATVHQGLTPCVEHERCWLVVRDLSMTYTQAAAQLVEPDTDPAPGDDLLHSAGREAAHLRELVGSASAAGTAQTG